MRKIIVFNMVTIDGFYAGVDGNIDWHQTDDDFNKFAIEQTKEFGMLIFGRFTYDLMKSYWPTEQARSDDPIIADLLNTTPKIVFSKTLKSVEETSIWKNITQYKDIVPEEIKTLKKESDK